MSKEKFLEIKEILENQKFLIKKKNIFINDKINDYSSNFGIQWNKFPLTQFDSHTGYPLTKNRLFNNSGWDFKELKNKLVVELGSGAGRFTEVLLTTGCFLISVEMSDAINVNAKNNKSENIIFLKSSLNELNFLNNLFDFVLCYGVAQHTPNLISTYKSCYALGKNGGKISIDHYIKFIYPTTKSIWRPITKRINPEILLKIIKFYIPYYFPIDTFIKTKLPTFMSKLIRFILPIPCSNYTNVKNVPQERNKLVEWAIMDTFDALGAKYDKPLTFGQLKNIVKKIVIHDYHISKKGPVLVLNIKK